MQTAQSQRQVMRFAQAQRCEKQSRKSEAAVEGCRDLQPHGLVNGWVKLLYRSMSEASYCQAIEGFLMGWRAMR